MALPSLTLDLIMSLEGRKRNRSTRYRFWSALTV